MPLTWMKAGASYKIRKIGGNDEVRRHLQSIGFVVGGMVTVVSAWDGNMIVNVKETRIAVNEAMASRIMV